MKSSSRNVTTNAGRSQKSARWRRLQAGPRSHKTTATDAVLGATARQVRAATATVGHCGLSQTQDGS